MSLRAVAFALVLSTLGCGAGQSAAPRDAGSAVITGVWVVRLVEIIQVEDSLLPPCTTQQIRMTLKDSAGQVTGSYSGFPRAYCEGDDASDVSEIVSLAGGTVSGTATASSARADTQAVKLVIGQPALGLLIGAGSATDLAGTGTLQFRRNSGETVPVRFRWNAFH